MNNKIKLLDGSMSFPLEKKGYNLHDKLWTGKALINDCLLYTSPSPRD